MSKKPVVRKKKWAAAEQHKESNPWWRVIANLPLSLGAALAGFSVVSIAFLLLEQFTLVTVLGVGVPVALLIFYFVDKYADAQYAGAQKERRIVDVLAILLVIGWGVFNLNYTAQTVYLYRDPGLYNTTARWLMEHENIVIPANNPFGEHDQLTTTSNAGVNMLPEEPDRLYTHGLRLLPTLVATTGRLAQESAALKTNVAIGALAIFALYGFTRLFARPRWALLTSGVLAASLPMLYFSRDTYTEPLFMLMFFTTLGLLHNAKVTQSRRLWPLSGLVAGVMLMTRIDAYLVLASLIVYLCAFMFFDKAQTSAAKLRHIIYFTLGLILSGVVAWLDLTELGTSYYRFHDHLVVQQLLLMAAVVGLGVLVLLLKHKTDVLDFIFKKEFSKFATKAALGLVLVMTIVLFARPLIVNQTNHYELQIIGGTESVVIQPEQTENSIEYDVGEQVVLWPTWYLGPFFSIIAFIGLLILIKRSLSDKTLVALPFLLSYLLITSIYLFRPGITPDHIWASRRLLPIVLPGLAFLSAYALSVIRVRKTPYQILIYVSVTIVFIIGVLNGSGFFLKERINHPLLTQVNDFCAVLPENTVVLLAGHLGLIGVQTVNSYCQVPTVRYIGHRHVTAEELSQFYENAVQNGKIPVMATFNEDRGLFTEGSHVRNLGVFEYKTIKKVFQDNPENMAPGDKELVYGFLSRNGTVQQVY